MSDKVNYPPKVVTLDDIESTACRSRSSKAWWNARDPLTAALQGAPTPFSAEAPGVRTAMRRVHAPMAIHCHIEGCSWLVTGCGGRVSGTCGLVNKLGLPPVGEVDGKPYYSMSQARPGLPGWACGWLRTPLNIGNREAITVPLEAEK